MNFDNSVSLYHVVSEDDRFEDAAGSLFALLKESQERFPDWPRIMYVDINGHVDQSGQFEEDFVELQQEFFFACIAPFLTAFDLPLVDAVNPNDQRNDVPDRLNIRAPGA
jgi:hypothetical protein